MKIHFVVAPNWLMNTSPHPNRSHPKLDRVFSRYSRIGGVGVGERGRSFIEGGTYTVTMKHLFVHVIRLAYVCPLMLSLGELNNEVFSEIEPISIVVT